MFFAVPHPSLILPLSSQYPMPPSFCRFSCGIPYLPHAAISQRFTRGTPQSSPHEPIHTEDQPRLSASLGPALMPAKIPNLSWMLNIIVQRTPATHLHLGQHSLNLPCLARALRLSLRPKGLLTQFRNSFTSDTNNSSSLIPSGAQSH
eukprot:1158619-Pelagomonas_calceolata.AAC.8